MMIPVEDALEVDAAHLACDGAAGDARVAPRHDVTADAAVRGDDDAPRQRDDVTADPSRDVRVAVHDDHAARDAPADEEVAVTDDDVVGDRPADAGGAVHRGDGAVDHVAGLDGDVAADGDDPVRRPTLAAEGGRRSCDRRDAQQPDRARDGQRGSGACARTLARMRRSCNGRDQLGVLDPSSMVAVWLWPDASTHSTFTLSPGWYGTIRWVS